jgi:membrane protein implicated in regulation of membrane protease activity
MDQYGWIIWIVIGVIFIVAEIFTLGFVLLWFGIGALLAGLMNLLGFGYVTQFLVFAVVSTVLTLLSRQILVKFLNTETEVAIGIEGLPGKIGMVTESSKGALNEAAVKVYGSVWRAYPEDGEEPLNQGEKVIITRIEGASVYVRKVKDIAPKSPDWRSE